ncbi:MAG TPA: four helix bundle protein [Candidatus Moranbacteria bacterium]|nr:four helix bundle protein [Candidatus Moranbacteria bacterium]
MTKFSNKFDLEERTSKFGSEIVRFCKKQEKDLLMKPIINQLIRSGTSVGANYCEANNASSRKDFRNKIFICKKEAQETKYWLRISSDYLNESQREKARKLWKECQELTMIFQKIVNTLDRKQ